MSATPGNHVADVAPGQRRTIVFEDPTQLPHTLLPYATAAIGFYGAAVLTRAGDDAADATVSFGRRVLHRLTGTGTEAPETGEPTAEQAELARTVAELGAAPRDPDAEAVLRFGIRRVLDGSPELRAEIAAWPRPPVHGATVVSTTGDQSPAVGVNYGGIHIGDKTPRYPHDENHPA
jgi:hypothetical protein